MDSQTIRILLNGEPVDIADVAPTTSLLAWLRGARGLTGAKEGCNEGDCGACTVVVGALRDEGATLHLATINACLRFVPTLDGKAVFTVEYLRRQAGGALHPVQQALVDCHGSQCGFCTPGFAMSLWDVYNASEAAGSRPEADRIRSALTGNLCRCTGYRPIIEAGARMFEFPTLALERDALHRRLLALQRATTLDYTHAGTRFLAPRTLAELLELRRRHPEATLLAGGTDVGVWANKQFRALGTILYLGEVAELHRLREGDGVLHIGAAISLTDAFAALARPFPELGELWERFASPPVRNAGTLGGNVANGSPIGDSMPALIALGSRVVLAGMHGERRLALEDFYLDYLKKDLRADEVVAAIEVPLPAAGLRVRSWKLSKRFDSDISAVCGAFALHLENGVVRAPRIAFGGMAATPRRAPHTEAALDGRPWTEATLALALEALATDFDPLTDLRASASYRRRAAAGLLRRFHLETRSEAPLAPAQTRAFAAFDPLPLPPGAARHPHPHESAHLHVSGEAMYVDDLPELARTAHAALGLSAQAHARITRLDLDAVRATPGVIGVLTAADIPGRNDCGPIVHDDPILAGGATADRERTDGEVSGAEAPADPAPALEVHYVGQPIFAVIADSHDAARRAARAAVIDYAPLPALLDPREAARQQSLVLPPLQLVRGTPAARLAAAPHRLRGRWQVGGQEHFYLEGQVACAAPREDGGMQLWCSTQHPTEMQHVVAHMLELPANRVVVETRRMGGGFGGKESQSALFACVAALAAWTFRRPVKLRPDRDDDMLITGKRHDFQYDYEIGFDDDGRVLALRIEMIARAGFSADLSGPVATRAVCHVDNAYYLSDVDIRALLARTNTQSNTAFRGFGGPQGAIAIEHVLDSIARHLGRDALDVRRLNFYGGEGRDTAPYGQTVADNVIFDLVAELEADSDYRARRTAIAAFNATSPVLKKGLALTPVKFGISFNLTHLNQAGALVHVYTDGSVLVNHGGTEMGQGVNTKVCQVVAHELGIDLARVRATATDTSKIANTSATAASTGADLNGKAAEDAARRIRLRLAEFAARTWGDGACAADVRFADDQVHVGGQAIGFAEVVRQAYLARVQLWSEGFYATPGLHWDATTLTGHPFYYFAYGAAVSEVLVDTLTGEWRLLRADLLHDAGDSINPAIDRGQIEGGFIQGMGWLTTEELWWNADGRLLTHAPSTYKIPAAHDCPADFRVRLYPNRNRADTILRSKAVGEPPLLLAFSVWFAIRDAIAAVGDGRSNPPLRAPATPEAILDAIDALRAQSPATPATHPAT